MRSSVSFLRRARETHKDRRPGGQESKEGRRGSVRTERRGTKREAIKREKRPIDRQGKRKKKKRT